MILSDRFSLIQEKRELKFRLKLFMTPEVTTESLKKKALRCRVLKVDELVEDFGWRAVSWCSRMDQHFSSRAGE